MEASCPDKKANEAEKTDYAELTAIVEKQHLDISTPQDKESLLDSIFEFCCGCIRDALQKPQDESKEALASIWETFTEVAQCVKWNDPFHDRLICLLLWTKEFDVLRRTLRTEEFGTRFSWECHYLVKVVQKSWGKLVFATHDTVVQQCSLASFTATALAVGSHDWLGITALWFLREALENNDTATIHLAPVTMIWIRTAGPKLLTFSVLRRKWENLDVGKDALNLTSIQTPGILAQRVGVTHGGFSLKRWRFWKERFESLAQDPDEETRAWAQDTVGYMTEFDSMLSYPMVNTVKVSGNTQDVLKERIENTKQKADVIENERDNIGRQNVNADDEYCGLKALEGAMREGCENENTN